MRKLIYRRAMRCGISSGRLRPFDNVHQKERVPVDINVLSDTLHFRSREVGHLDPPFHLPNLRVTKVCRHQDKFEASFVFFLDASGI